LNSRLMDLSCLADAVTTFWPEAVTTTNYTQRLQ